MKQKSMRLLLLAFLLALPVAAGAQSTDSDTAQSLTEAQAEVLFGDLYRAFDITRICRKLEGEGLNEKVTAIISAQTGNKVAIGKQLSLIDAAKLESKKTVKAEGCEGPNVSENLGVYDAKIAPHL